ncbi:ATP-binding protein [Spirillospora sp. NPDC127200]
MGFGEAPQNPRYLRFEQRNRRRESGLAVRPTTGLLDSGGRLPDGRLVSHLIEFASETESVRYGRRWLGEKLVASSVPSEDVHGDLVLMLSETLTNAVVHGAGLRVAVYLLAAARCVEVGVHNRVASDVRSPRPTCAESEPAAEDGRGLGAIVEQLADEWGWSSAPHEGSAGVLVWFRKGW